MKMYVCECVKGNVCGNVAKYRVVKDYYDFQALGAIKKKALISRIYVCGILLKQHCFCGIIVI